MKVKEYMLRIVVKPYTCRLWLDASKPHDFNYIENQVRYFLRPAYDPFRIPHINIEKVCEEIESTLNGINAIEIVDKYGNGSLLYPNWP